MKLVTAAVVTGAVGVGACKGATAIFAEPASGSTAAAAGIRRQGGQPGSHGARRRRRGPRRARGGRPQGRRQRRTGRRSRRPGGLQRPSQSAASTTSEQGDAASPGTSAGADGAPGSGASGGDTGGGTGGSTGGNPGGGPAEPPTPPSPPPGPPSPPGGGGSDSPGRRPAMAARHARPWRHAARTGQGDTPAGPHRQAP